MTLETRVERTARLWNRRDAEQRDRPPPEPEPDPSVWDWYGETCPSGRQAGECRAHPRARATQRPPGGDWRVWAYVAGRGAGKTRAGACWDVLLDAGNLILHPRCLMLKEAFQTYRRQFRGGQWIDFPADGHPEEDLIDALRGGVRDALPEGNVLARRLPRAHVWRVL
jgi:hypothetical protein